MSTADTSAADVPATASGVTDTRLTRLRRWNLALTVLHAAQAVAVLVLATDFAITITSTFPSGPPGTAVSTAQRAGSGETTSAGPRCPPLSCGRVQ